MMRLRATLVTLAGLIAAAACTDHPATAPAPPPPPPPPPPPGSGIVSLATPNADDGALRLTLHGPALSTLQVSSSSNLFYTRMASDSEARVILIGNLAAGPLLTFKIASGQPLTAYGATLEQVASRTDSLRVSLSGYALTIAATP